MKRFVALVLLVVMVMTVAIASGSSRKDVSDSMIEYTKDIIKDVLDMYNKNGTLDDGDLEFGYDYFLMYITAKRTSVLETFYPVAYSLSTKMDAYTNIEKVVTEYWSKMLDGEIEREKFEKLLMGLIEAQLKE